MRFDQDNNSGDNAACALDVQGKYLFSLLIKTNTIIIIQNQQCTFVIVIWGDYFGTLAYGRTSRVWDSLLVGKSGCAGGRGFVSRPGQ